MRINLLIFLISYAVHGDSQGFSCKNLFNGPQIAQWLSTSSVGIRGFMGPLPELKEALKSNPDLHVALERVGIVEWGVSLFLVQSIEQARNHSVRTKLTSHQGIYLVGEQTPTLNYFYDLPKPLHDHLPELFELQKELASVASRLTESLDDVALQEMAGQLVLKMNALDTNGLFQQALLRYYSLNYKLVDIVDGQVHEIDSNTTQSLLRPDLGGANLTVKFIYQGLQIWRTGYTRPLALYGNFNLQKVFSSSRTKSVLREARAAFANMGLTFEKNSIPKNFSDQFAVETAQTEVEFLNDLELVRASTRVGQLSIGSRYRSQAAVDLALEGLRQKNTFSIRLVEKKGVEKIVRGGILVFVEGEQVKVDTVFYGAKKANPVDTQFDQFAAKLTTLAVFKLLQQVGVTDIPIEMVSPWSESMAATKLTPDEALVLLAKNTSGQSSIGSPKDTESQESSSQKSRGNLIIDALQIYQEKPNHEVLGNLLLPK